MNHFRWLIEIEVDLDLVPAPGRGAVRAHGGDAAGVGVMSKQTLRQALHLARSGKSRALARAASVLKGLPVGGWPETQQAMLRLREELPFRVDRAYTADEFVSAAYRVDAADRYRSTVEDP